MSNHRKIELVFPALSGNGVVNVLEKYGIVQNLPEEVLFDLFRDLEDHIVSVRLDALRDPNGDLLGALYGVQSNVVLGKYLSYLENEIIVFLMQKKKDVSAADIIEQLALNYDISTVYVALNKLVTNHQFVLKMICSQNKENPESQARYHFRIRPEVRADYARLRQKKS